MSTAPEDGPGLIVTVGRPWDPSVDGPPPTPDQLRPHLTAQQREFLEQFRRGGEHLYALLGVAVDGCPPPARWRPADDTEVRGCLYALAVCRDMTRRAEWYSAEANQSLRIEAGESLSSRLPGMFLDNDPRFDILHAAMTLRGRITEYVDWLTVAARHRGILTAGQPLDSSAERQLEYAVASSGTDTAGNIPSGGVPEPNSTTTPQMKSPPAPRATDQRHELAAHLLRLKGSGVKTVRQILAYLDTPAGRDLNALVEELRRWKKKGGGKDRTRRNVVNAALQLLRRPPFATS